MIKVKTFGWRNNSLDVISRIESGLINNGHLLSDIPDLIYKNESFYDEAINYSYLYPNAVKIFNVLDLQLNNKNYNLTKLRNQLLEANYVTCISDTVKNDIKNYLNIEAINIGCPIKDIYYFPDIKKEIDFTIIGRNLDPNKRAEIFQSIIFGGYFTNKTYAVVGPEPIPLTKRGWLGIINDKELNEIYNMSKFVICCSLKEGLLLPAIEACCAGSIPIIASDMSTAKELNMPEFTVKTDIKNIIDLIDKIDSQYDKYQKIALNYGELWKSKLNKDIVAKRIIDIYQNGKI